MTARDVKTTIVCTAFANILAGAVAFALAGPWGVGVVLVACGLWLLWDQALRERRES